MKRLTAFLIRLYPRAWRDRYETEFDALIEDAGAGWREIPDLLKGALAMRIAYSAYAKPIGIFGLAGLLACGLISFTLPDKFVSTVTIAAPVGGSITDRVGRTAQRVLNRHRSKRSSRASICTRGRNSRRTPGSNGCGATSGSAPRWFRRIPSSYGSCTGTLPRRKR